MSVVLARLRARDTSDEIVIALAERADAGVDVVVRRGSEERRHERKRTASAVEAVRAAVAALIAEGDFELLDDGSG